MFFHIPFDVSQSRRTAAYNKIALVCEHNAETAFSRRFHHRIPETGPDRTSQVFYNLSPLVADQI